MPSLPVPPKRLILVLNRKARAGDSPIDPVVERLQRAGATIAHVYSDDPAGLHDFVVAHAGNADALVVGGGDGTVSSAVSSALDTGLPLGVLPMGTGNDFARTLGVPLDLPGAADVIAAGRRRRVDVGTVNDIPFLNVASLGISVELAQQLTTETKRRFGTLGYVITSFAVLFKARTFGAVIKLPDGAVRVRTLQIGVGNGRHFGGGLTVAPDASIDDGLLDLFSLETERLWRLFLLAPALRSGDHHAFQEVRSARAKEFEVHTNRPRPINVDGEIRTVTPARFGIRPAALEVFAPAPPASLA
jgi:YegS/Rv2252/BmrU family lipid kinase